MKNFIPCVNVEIRDLKDLLIFYVIILLIQCIFKMIKNQDTNTRMQSVNFDISLVFDDLYFSEILKLAEMHTHDI